MNKADAYYIKNLNDILENGFWDENSRPKYKDGTPAHSKFITGVYETYDISKGEFPITTLRNTAIKTGIREMLAIYQTQENTRESFENMGVFWWESWMNENGNIGRSYPYNFESHRPNEMKKSVVKIKPRIIDEKYKHPQQLDLVNPLQPSIDDIIYFDRYIVIGKSNKNDNKKRCYYLIQFLKTGYIAEMRNDRIGISRGFDVYERKTYGVGFIGDYSGVKNIKSSHIKKLMVKWENMFRRCYSGEYSDNYSGVFVHHEWHSFTQFLNDVRYLPQYHLAKEMDFEGWDLDKDYYGSNCYSKNTCVFLHRHENSVYRKTQIKPIMVSENNNKFYELTYSSLAQTLNLSVSYIRRIVKRGYYKNLKFSLINENDNLYRYELSKNQVNDLLKGLKENPFGRRHIVSFWNWSNIDKKELVECAFMTMWSVRKINEEYYLDMTLIQRSNDYVMAGYINKIQYVALQMMVAGHLGYKVGLFNHLTQNLHIYDRHFTAVEEILNRQPLDVEPHIRLMSNKNFYDYTINDFLTYHTDIPKLSSPLEIAI